MTARPVKHYAAAGGVVIDGDKVLVLLRPSRGEVRLPKGHVEPGETDLEAAVREVGEESGYVDLEMVADLGHQHVAFDLGAARVERDERFFLFRRIGPTTRPRNHRDRKFEPTWVSWSEAATSLTFEPGREWVRRAAQVCGVNLP